MKKLILILASVFTLNLFANQNVLDEEPILKPLDQIQNITSQDSENFLDVIYRNQTKEEEFLRIINYLKKRSWFIEQYKNISFLTFPEAQAFQQIPIDSDFDEIELQKVFDDIYCEKDYENSLDCFIATKPIVLKAMQKLSKLQENWNFKLFDKYEIVLTLYGTAGSYNADDGIIKSKVRADGKRTANRPIHEIIIHEMVHIGIEKAIVSKYNLSHWEKERLVDLICLKYLNDLLQNYSMQNISNTNIDDYVSEDAIEQNLPSAIGAYVEEFQRQ